jgi:pSer/pThr/pTyr-binding forkhead associated (FHA) protein
MAMLEIAVFARDHVITRAIREGEMLTLGRAAECDLHIPDPSVSRKHAVLRMASELSIEDLEHRSV